MRFFAYGHKNTLATHRNTIEFTKEDHLTLKGDCILGICADFQAGQIDPGWDRIEIEISAGGISDRITARFNKDFSGSECMVIRKSGFLSARTFAIEADKAAIDIDRRIVRLMKDPCCKMEVRIRPLDLA